jgi:hypothetical protein
MTVARNRTLMRRLARVKATPTAAERLLDGQREAEKIAAAAIDNVEPSLDDLQMWQSFHERKVNELLAKHFPAGRDPLQKAIDGWGAAAEVDWLADRTTSPLPDALTNTPAAPVTDDFGRIITPAPGRRQ